MPPGSRSSLSTKHKPPPSSNSMTKTRTSITALKTDIHTLTCILRLRLSPPTPYSLIASKLLTHMPQHIPLLRKTTIPRSEKLKPSFFPSNGVRKWLEKYLEERFEVAERWQNESWVTAWELEQYAVEEIVGLVGLDGEGYGVWGAREMEVQRAWRRSGDWRAGSTPCFCKGLVDVDVDDPGSWGGLGAIGSEREEALRALRNGSVGVDNCEVVEEERNVAEKVEVIPTVSSAGEEKNVEIPEVAPQLKDDPDRIRVLRVLKRGEKILDNWSEQCE